jgi:hypothetical protein
MHFFVDQTVLNSAQTLQQLPVDKFGEESTTRYNATSQIQFPSPARAHACESGLIIAQQSSLNPSLVNVMLKPSSRNGVAYYVYRGILKSSMINGALTIPPSSLEATEFTNRIYKDNPFFNPVTNPITASTIGFNSGLAGETDVELIFSNLSGTTRSMLVVEGEWFGTFSSTHKSGFEIIREPDKIPLDLEFLRKGRIVIDTADIGPNPTAFQLRAKRQEILAFVDPVAFFGSFYKIGIRVSVFSTVTISGRTSRTVRREQLYALLTKFLTKNRVYLDLRSEKGYSYDLYQNYGDSSNDFQHSRQNSNFTTTTYRRSDWPIFYIDASETSNSDFNNLWIKLRVDDNINPIIFVENPQNKATEDENSFISTGILNGDQTTWSQSIHFVFPNIALGSAKENVASYIKVYYFRNKHNASNFPPTVLRHEKYFDSAFCPIDLPFIGSSSTNNGVIHCKGLLNFVREEVQTDGTGNFGYAASNSVFWTGTRVLFSSAISNGLTNSDKKFLRTDITNSYFNGGFIDRFWGKLYFIFRQYTNTQISANPINIPGINYYKEGKNVGMKEDVLLLGLSKSEFDFITGLQGFSNEHHRYIYLDSVNEYWDTDNVQTAEGNRFYRYRVNVQGFDNNGNRVILIPTRADNSQIFVFTRDKLFFSSLEFSSEEIVNQEINRIEFSINSRGKVKVNDNLDLSLLHDTNNGNILRKRIYYRYLNAQGQTTNTWNFAAYQIAGRRYGDRSPASGPPYVPPAGFVQTIFYHNPAPNPPPNTSPPLTGVDVQRAYWNQGTDTIITVGKFDQQGFFQVIYPGSKKKKFMVLFDQTLIDNANNLAFEYYQSRRYYAAPELAAAALGAFIEVGSLGFTLQSTGCSLADGSCHPSLEHVNGEAIDIRYREGNGGNITQDIAIIIAFRKFGFGKRKIGINSVFDPLAPYDSDHGRDTLHNTHLHCGVLNLTD